MDTAPAAIEIPVLPTATSTNQTRDGNKVEPSDPGGNDTRRGGPAGAIKAVISNLRDALKGGRAHSGSTDSASTDSASTDSASTGNSDSTGSNSDSTGSPGRHRAN
jgi:hypothetical protein